MSEHVLYEIEAAPGLLSALFLDARVREHDRVRGTIAYIRGNAEIEAVPVQVRALEEFLDKVSSRTFRTGGAVRPPKGVAARRLWLLRPCSAAAARTELSDSGDRVRTWRRGARIG